MEHGHTIKRKHWLDASVGTGHLQVGPSSRSAAPQL